MMGCCTDKACNSDTCMKLPGGESCATCIHTIRCVKLFGHKPEDIYCDFFPRRFRKRPESMPFDPASLKTAAQSTPKLIDPLALGKSILSAAGCDKDSPHPASEEAHAIWARILDKPYFALTAVQAMLDEVTLRTKERDRARTELLGIAKSLLGDEDGDVLLDIDMEEAEEARDRIALALRDEPDETFHFVCPRCGGSTFGTNQKHVAMKDGTTQAAEFGYCNGFVDGGKKHCSFTWDRKRDYAYFEPPAADEPAKES